VFARGRSSMRILYLKERNKHEYSKDLLKATLWL
jgi:hypothetical protein